MAIITLHNVEIDGLKKTGDYTIDTNRKFGGYQSEDLICFVHPFFGVPLRLEIAIRTNGDIIFRSWTWARFGNSYLHTNEKRLNSCCSFVPTQAQIDTVNGLFSGRIKFEELKLAVGASVQKICPINIQREEELTGEKIYLA